MKKRIIQIFNSVLVFVFLPFIKLLSKLKKPEPKCSYKDYLEISIKIKPGDVLLSRENWSASNLFISGFWGHAAIYLGHGKVLEAVPNRVRIIHLSQFVMICDAIAVLRPEFKIKFVNASDDFLGMDYDFHFKSKNPGWYCSELVYEYLDIISIYDLEFKPKTFLGQPRITPNDFYMNREEFDLIYENRHAAN